MTNDVSNTTIAILLVLTILVSIVGTWTVLDAAKQTQPSRVVVMSPSRPVDAGHVQLAVDQITDQKEGGKVSLAVLKS